MLTQHQDNQSTSQADLDLMAELNTSCFNLRSNIYRLVSEMDDKEEGLGMLDIFFSKFLKQKWNKIAEILFL